MKIQRVKETICNSGLIILAIIVIPSLAVSLSRISSIGWKNIMGVHIVAVMVVVLLAIFRKHFSYTFKSLVIVSMVALVGIGELYNFGILGVGGAYLAHASIIAAILLGSRNSIIIFFIFTIYIFVIYLGFNSNRLVIPIDLSSYSNNLSTWVNYYFDYLTIFATIIAAFYYIYSALVQSIRELEVQNSTLESQVEERTAELSKQNEQLQTALHAERKAVKSNLNFIDMISHEYRTPLSVITSSLDIITNNNNAEERETQIRRMHLSADRLVGLFELSLNKRRILDANIVVCPEETDFTENIINVAADLTRQIYPNHHIIIDDSLWNDRPLRVDKELMITALSNILDNACKYSEPSIIRIKMQEYSEQAIFTITDRGSGIPERDIPHIFEKYYRSESTGTRPGAGVGLYLLKMIIDLHNGQITLNSKETQGTEVRLTLPF